MQNGDTAIDTATDLAGVANAKTTALNAMDAVKTIAESIFVSLDGYYKYELNGTNVTIIEYLKSDKIVSIPEQIEGKTVTGIGNGVFMNKDITSVTIPNSITNIGTSAFNGNSLTSLIIPSNVSIESYAFISNSLTNITIGSNVTIGDRFLSGSQNSFRDAYTTGGAGTYTGTQSGTWTKVVAPAPANLATFTSAILDDNNYIFPCLILNNLSNIEYGSTFDIKKLTYSDGFQSYTLGGTYESFGDPAGSNQGNYYYNSVDKKLIIVLTDNDISGLSSLPLLDCYGTGQSDDTLSAAEGWNVFNGVKAQAVTNVPVTTVQ